MRFELTVPCGTAHFKCAGINHYPTPPVYYLGVSCYGTPVLSQTLSKLQIALQEVDEEMRHTTRASLANNVSSKRHNHLDVVSIFEKGLACSMCNISRLRISRDKQNTYWPKATRSSGDTQHTTRHPSPRLRVTPYALALNNHSESVGWRRGRDSNPRAGFPA